MAAEMSSGATRSLLIRKFVDNGNAQMVNVNPVLVWGTNKLGWQPGVGPLMTGVLSTCLRPRPVAGVGRRGSVDMEGGYLAFPSICTTGGLGSIIDRTERPRQSY